MVVTSLKEGTSIPEYPYKLKESKVLCKQFITDIVITEEDFQKNKNRILMEIEGQIAQRIEESIRSNGDYYFAKFTIDFGYKDYSLEQKERLESEVKFELNNAGYKIITFSKVDGSDEVFSIRCYLCSFKKSEIPLLVLGDEDIGLSIISFIVFMVFMCTTAYSLVKYSDILISLLGVLIGFFVTLVITTVLIIIHLYVFCRLKRKIVLSYFNR